MSILGDPQNHAPPFSGAAGTRVDGATVAVLDRAWQPGEGRYPTPASPLAGFCLGLALHESGPGSLSHVYLCNEGPDNSTNVMVYALFTAFWKDNRYGFASAIDAGGAAQVSAVSRGDRAMACYRAESGDRRGGLRPIHPDPRCHSG